MKDKEIWIVKIRGSEFACVYDDEAKAWRNAKRMASSFDEIDYTTSTTLAEFIKYGIAYFFTKEGRTIFIESEYMNPSFREVNDETS